MESQPQEILAFIIKNIHAQQDLQSIRLVNRQLAATATPFLFSTIPVWLGLKSLEVLTSLSDHPQLAHHVKTLVISPLRFIEHQDASIYEPSIRSWLVHHYPSSSVSHDLMLASCMTAYEMYIKRQRILGAKSLDLKILTRAMDSFPRLRELNIDFNDIYIGAEELTDAFGFFYNQDFLTRDCEYTIPLVMRAMSSSRARIKSFKFGDNYFYSQMPEFGQVACSDNPARPSACPTCSHPMDLPLDQHAPPSSTMSPWAMHKTLSALKNYECEQALRGVKELFVSTVKVPSNDVPSLSALYDGTRQIIGHLPQLEVFKLGYVDTGGEPNSLDRTIVGVFGISRLHHLRDVKLSEIESSGHDLINFIERHAKTLVDVRFEYATIVDSDWPTVLTHLRNVSFSGLKTFILEDCFPLMRFCCRDEDIAVHDYILRRSERIIDVPV